MFGKMTINEILFPICFVSKLAGTMPIKFISSFPVKLVASPLNFAFSVLLTILSFCNMILTIWMVDRTSQSQKNVTSTARVTIEANSTCTHMVTHKTDSTQYVVIQILNPQILIVMSLGAHWVSIFRTKPHLPLFVDYLVSIDTKLPFLVKGLNLSKTYQLMALRFFVILACSFVVFGFYIFLHAALNPKSQNMFWIVTLIYHNFVSLTCELQLLIFILMIKSRFRLVNGALSAMCRRVEALQKSLKSEKVLYPKIEKGADLHQVELAHDCYLKLVDAWILMNKIYAVQVLFSTSGCFLKSLFNVYLLSTCCNDKRSLFHPNTLNSAMWLTFYFARFTMLALESTWASDESDETKAITALMGHLYVDPTIREELDIFWMNSSNRKLSFSTCGLFTLNAGLILKACVTGITYLVLLVQFKPTLGLN